MAKFTNLYFLRNVDVLCNIKIINFKATWVKAIQIYKMDTVLLGIGTTHLEYQLDLLPPPKAFGKRVEMSRQVLMSF